MDPAVVTAVIAAMAAVAGPPITWQLTKRRESAATVELTEAQADQIRQQIYDRLVDQLRGEISRLQARVTDLEARLAELVGVQADRDQLRIQLAAAQAQLQAKEREVLGLRSQLAAVLPHPA